MADKSYKVVYMPYYSVRTDLLPKRGTLTLSDDRAVTVTDDTDGHTVINTPLASLKVVRPRNFLAATKPYTAILYVGINEAYEVVFTSDDQATAKGIETYEKLLQGDKSGAMEALKAANQDTARSSAYVATVDQANAEYREFLDAARAAGVYRSSWTSVPIVVGIIVFAIIALAIVGIFIAAARS